MAKKTFKLPIWPASGGLDQSSIPGAANPNTLEDCDNILFTVNGSRKKKWGLNTFYRSGFTPTISSDMRGMTDFWRNVGSVQTQRQIVFAGGLLWADSDNGRFTDVTGTTSLVSSDQVTFDAFDGFLIAAFENAVPQYYNMTGDFADLTGTPPDGSLVRVHAGRAWLSGVNTSPHTIYYSVADNPEDWTLGGGGGSIAISQGDNDPVGITAIFPSFHDDLYVAKRRSLYRIRTFTSADLASTSFAVQPVVNGIGCLSHNTVAATPNDVIWCSERGIHSLRATDQYGDVEAAFLSYPIHELYNNEVSFERAKNMWAVYAPELNSYLLAYTKRGKRVNTEILGFNIVLNQWFRWQDYDCAAISRYVDGRNKSRVLVGTETLDVGLLDNDITLDFEQSVPSYFTTPIIYPLGRPDITVNFKNLWLFLKPQTTGEVSISYKIDDKKIITTTADQTGSGAGVIGTAIIGQDIIGGSGDIKKIRVPLQGEGSGIRFTFSNIPADSDLDEDCDIYGYVLEGEYAEDSAITTVTSSS